MVSTANDHGVYTCPERVVLYEGGRLNRVVIYLVETPTGWRYGYDIAWGGIGIGAGGAGALPSKHGSAYGTRADAENAAIEKVCLILHEARKLSCSQAVLDDLETIEEAVAGTRQMRLF